MIGGITSTGTFSTTDDTVCSSNYMLCDGLRIERKSDTKTQIRVYYYDINKQYLGCSDKIFGNYIRNADFPLAGFCRIVLYPHMQDKSSDEFYVTIFDVDDIVKEFDITVNRKQDFGSVCRSTLKNELEEWVMSNININEEFQYSVTDKDLHNVFSFNVTQNSYDKTDYKNTLDKTKDVILINALKDFKAKSKDNFGELLEGEFDNIENAESVSEFVYYHNYLKSYVQNYSLVTFNFIYNDRGSGVESLGVKIVYTNEHNTLRYEMSFKNGETIKRRMYNGKYTLVFSIDTVDKISSLSSNLNITESHVNVDIKQDYTSLGNVVYCSSSTQSSVPDGVWTDGLELGWNCWYANNTTTSLTASFAGYSSASWYNIQTPLKNNQVFSFNLTLGRYFGSDDTGYNVYSMDPVLRLSEGTNYDYYSPFIGIRLRNGKASLGSMNNINHTVYNTNPCVDISSSDTSIPTYYFAFSRYNDYIYMSVKLSEGFGCDEYTTVCRFKVDSEPYQMVLAMMSASSKYCMTYILDDIRIDDVENLSDYIPELNQ